MSDPIEPRNQPKQLSTKLLVDKYLAGSLSSESLVRQIQGNVIDKMASPDPYDSAL